MPGAMTVQLFIVAVPWLVYGLASPQLHLQPPDGTRTPQRVSGCVQGSEIMGGLYSLLPPCPPWVDGEGRCHIGDQTLQMDQCLGLMSMADYKKLPRGRPPTIPQPPAIPRPLNIHSYHPPGWSDGGSPPGGWPPSHPPGFSGSHYGPPGTNTNIFHRDNGIHPPGMGVKRSSAVNPKTNDGNGILPPSIRNLRRYSQTYIDGLGPSSAMAPAPVMSDSKLRSFRNLREKNWNQNPWFLQSRSRRRNRERGRGNRRRESTPGGSSKRGGVELAAPSTFHYNNA